MSDWTIQDVSNRRCLKYFRAEGGRWDAIMQVWRFDTPEAAANALASLYRETRATRPQREQLIQMIVEGTAQAIWPVPFTALTIDRVHDVSTEDAERLISCGCGFRARKLAQFIEQMPPNLVAKRFNLAAFERGRQARRSQIHPVGFGRAA